MKILHISFIPCNEVITRFLFIKEFMAEGWEVEYWNLGQLLNFPGIAASLPVCDYRTFDERERFVHQFQQEVSEKRGSIILNLQFHFEPHMDWIFNLVYSSGCPVSFFSIGNQPVPAISTLGRITNLLKLNPLDFARRIRNRVMRESRRQVYSPHWVFAAGSQSAQPYIANSKIVKINSGDYDEGIALMSRRKPEEKHIVFLDQYLPYHPDFEFLGIPRPDPETYFASMKSLFERLEDKFGKKVVVAAHPKSDYGGHEYGGRDIIRDATIPLIYDALFVVSQTSASMGSAVQFRKPIFFVYNDSFRSMYSRNYYPMLTLFAKTLGMPLLNSDHLDAGSVDLPVVNETYYLDYILKYLSWEESMHDFSFSQIRKTFLSEYR